MYMRGILRNIKRVILFGGILALSSGVFSLQSQAAINPQINFQGKLTNPDGTNVTNGTYSIVFSIYSVASGGSAIWTETQGSVSVTDGIFRVALGSVTSLPGSVDFNSNSLFLGIRVGADAEMTPRVQFTASPYAFNSDRLGGLQNTGFVQLGQSATPQTDASTNSSVFINKTAAGNIVQLQSSGVNAFTLTNSGDMTFGENGNKTISVAIESTNAAGNSLSIIAGQGGAGAGANAGGALVLQAGAGGGTNGNGANLTLAAGAGAGIGTVGSVLVRNPADSTTGFQIQDAGSTRLFVVDSTNDRIQIGNDTADGIGVLLVADTKNTLGDPTGVNGGIYYNSSIQKFRCFERGAWNNCDAGSGTRYQTYMRKATTTATTHTGVGLTVPTVSATAASDAQAESNYVSFTTTAAANNVSGYATGAFTATQLRYAPVMKSRIRTGAAITTTRYWVGLSSAAISGQAPTIASAAFGTSYVGVGYQAGINGGNFVCGSGDGTNHTGVDTGVAVAANTYYDIIIDYYSATNTLVCAIATNGGNYVTVTKATNIPNTATSLGMNALVNNLTSGAGRAISVATISLEQN
jgi:hypothetical protein